MLNRVLRKAGLPHQRPQARDGPVGTVLAAQDVLPERLQKTSVFRPVQTHDPSAVNYTKAGSASPPRSRLYPYTFSETGLLLHALRAARREGVQGKARRLGPDLHHERTHEAGPCTPPRRQAQHEGNRSGLRLRLAAVLLPCLQGAFRLQPAKLFRSEVSSRLPPTEQCSGPCSASRPAPNSRSAPCRARPASAAAASRPTRARIPST